VLSEQEEKTVRMGDHTRVEFVQAMYQRLVSGDVEGARSMWSDDAVWHLAGDHEFAKDYNPDSYFQLLGTWAERFPSHVPEFKEARDLGEEGAMIIMESTNGMAPGVASGVMIYRVADGKIREGWAIPTFGGGRYAF
jgi:ketosteroid isomerase-like protein